MPSYIWHISVFSLSLEVKVSLYLRFTTRTWDCRRFLELWPRSSWDLLFASNCKDLAVFFDVYLHAAVGPVPPSIFFCVRQVRLALPFSLRRFLGLLPNLTQVHELTVGNVFGEMRFPPCLHTSEWAQVARAFRARVLTGCLNFCGRFWLAAVFFTAFYILYLLPASLLHRPLRKHVYLSPFLSRSNYLSSTECRGH